MKYTAGIFIIDSPIIINDNTVIQGDGMNKTTLIINEPYKKRTSTMITALDSNGVNNITISDLTINMNFMYPVTETNIISTPVIDFSFGTNSNINIKNVRIINTFTNNIDDASSAIQIKNGSNINIVNCIFNNIGKSCIDISSKSKNVNIFQNRMTNTGDDAIILNTTSEFKIYNNFIYHCGNRGISLLGVNNGVVYKNYINYTQSTGIVVSNFNTVQPCFNIQIRQNKFINIGYYQHPLNNLSYHNYHFNIIEIEKLKENDCDIFFNIVINENIFYNSKGKTVCIINLNPNRGIKNIKFIKNKYENKTENLLIDIIYPDYIFISDEWWNKTNSIINE